MTRRVRTIRTTSTTSVPSRCACARVGGGRGGRRSVITQHAARSPWQVRLAMNRWPALLGGALIAGVLGGALAARFGLVLPLAALIAVTVGVAILLDARVGIYTALAIICLMPYATLP